jgi:hypothetical protein
MYSATLMTLVLVFKLPSISIESVMDAVLSARKPTPAHDRAPIDIVPESVVSANVQLKLKGNPAVAEKSTVFA